MAGLTKRHYIMLSAAFHRVWEEERDIDEYTFHECLRAVGKVCSRDNKNFRWERFEQDAYEGPPLKGES